MSDLYWVYDEPRWLKAWKRTRFMYQIRHCEVSINEDLSIHSKTVDQIAIRKAIEHFNSLPEKVREGAEDEEIDFPDFHVSFLSSKSDARILWLRVFNVIDSKVEKTEPDSVSSVWYRCSSEQLNRGIYPWFEYHEVGRIHPLPETDEWEWESANDCFLYEELWGGRQLFYNLTVALPEWHVPYLVHTSKRLDYVIGIRGKRMAIHFDNFRKVSNISIVYRLAPNSYRFLIENPTIVVKGQSNTDLIVSAIRGSFAPQIETGTGVHLEHNRIKESSMAGAPKGRSKPVRLEQFADKGDSPLIKILFLAANPSDTTRLRLAEEIRSIDQALRQSEFRSQFRIEQHWAVRPSDIQSCLLWHKPDIVHFSGHGSTSNKLIFEDDSGSSRPVSVRAMSQLFSVLRDNVRCVVLNACYSEEQAQAIAKHVDCVIGMSQAIGDKAAISFAVAFYQALGFGRDVNTAFDSGCLQIDLEGLDEQDVPRLIATRCNPKDVVFAAQG
jgi:hypothetical protein